VASPPGRRGHAITKRWSWRPRIGAPASVHALRVQQDVRRLHAAEVYALADALILVPRPNTAASLVRYPLPAHDARRARSHPPASGTGLGGHLLFQVAASC
jgi:hypothetical protein